MKKSDDIFENLLRDSYEDYSIPEFKNSWAKIHSKILKRNFFKFQLNIFNIYYSVLIVSSVIIGSIALNNNTSSLTTIEQIEPPVENVQNIDIEVHNKSVYVSPNEIDNEEMQTQIQHNNTSDNGVSKPSTSINHLDKGESPIPFVEQKLDTRSEISNSNGTNEEKQIISDSVAETNTLIQEKIVKKIYVEQPKLVVKDTVVNTVKIKKRRK